MKVGLMAVDGGVTTGLAWGVFEVSVGEGPGGAMLSGREIVESGLLLGEFGSCDVEWGLIESAYYVCWLWTELQYLWWGMGVRRTEMVIEAFHLRTGVRSEDVLSSRTLAALVIGMRHGRASQFADSGRGLLMPVTWTWQESGDAMSAVTNDRLRAWGYWERGASEHRRDATRHLLLAARGKVGIQLSR